LLSLLIEAKVDRAVRVAEHDQLAIIVCPRWIDA